MISKKISIVVPVFNSHGFLHDLLKSIDVVRIANNWELELILIDDGSKDDSFGKITELSKTYSYIKGIKLSRNFGHQATVRTGLGFCRGEYIAIIDDDLQDPPDLLPRFFGLLEKGYDVVYGIRKQRKENTFLKFFYSAFYRLLQRLSDTSIPLDSGDFCVMNKKVVEKMLLLNEKDPFLRGIRAWVGFNQIGLEYERQKRIEGNSGYTLKKLLKIAIDGIFSFSTFPIRLITMIGIIGSSVAFFYGLYTMIIYFFVGIPVKGFTSLALLIVFFSSLILVSLGILGEYISRIYIESKNRPHTIISEFINFN
jgi:glycosyltransferase involved in cell wall biosynthesis